ncbi:hypothetical protein SXCC_03125 [Gluconacetobacter sp. SXCC-1]|nr:hypothetical protein SXCC_03125 [Gluconacetobacter sp. SXCC-1]
MRLFSESLRKRCLFSKSWHQKSSFPINALHFISFSAA